MKVFASPDRWNKNNNNSEFAIEEIGAAIALFSPAKNNN
jgi:hypothetical protein